MLEEALDKINNIADSLHLVATADVSLPRSRLVEAVQRIENEIRHRTKCALDASSTQDRPGHFFDFQEQVQYLLTPPPAEQPSASRMTPAPTPTPAAPLSTSQQKSNFWSSFTQTSHLLIPNTTPRSTPTSDQISLGLSSDLSITPPTIPIAYANTPFTQRLFRACAESGFRYLTNETVSDEEMWPQFGLMLQRMPRAQIIAYFRRVVATVPCNPLQDARFPFLSLGGAGGHFNVRHPQGRPGLQYLWALQAANGVVELQSDEEWFDVHDIEGFLVNQGLELTGPQAASLNNALALYTPGAYGADILTASASAFGGVSETTQGSGRWIKTINEDALVEGEFHSFLKIFCINLTFSSTERVLCLHWMRCWVPAT